ncbi:MAG: PA14 domain-containing protein, partial [Lentisphaeraceae bacterium]|nr:PA14 domain-containing protein [Lentisphaeraceae bacterium]
TGLYTFHVKSDDGSRITIGGKKVVELNVLSDRDPWESKGSIALSSGFHKLKIDYFQFQVHSSLDIKYSVDGGPKIPVTKSMLYRK